MELFLFVVRCAIWYHLYNLKNVKNSHGRVLILVKLQAIFAKSSILDVWHGSEYAYGVKSKDNQNMAPDTPSFLQHGETGKIKNTAEGRGLKHLSL